ncbi:MAG TPA: hypothetical protein VK452_01725 [Dissulfurispiraceae bacterium]|nr:hypothetical protein [Dissulfurispiraceae bacterium]
MSSSHFRPLTVLIFLLMAFTLGACSHNIREEFDMSLDKYNRILNRNEIETACLFAAAGIRDEYIAKAGNIKNTRIIDYHVVNAAYSEDKLQATVDVDISYYSLFTNKVKSVRDTQQWIYSEEKGVKGWRINSLLPEFK